MICNENETQLLSSLFITLHQLTCILITTLWQLVICVVAEVLLRFQSDTKRLSLLGIFYPAIMFFIICGTRYMGSCDYFTYNGEEYFVNGKMFHVQLCPLFVEDALLRLPHYPDHGLNVTEVPNIRGRCFFWAAVRSYIIVASVISLIIGLISLNGSSALAALFITLAIVGAFAGVAAIFYKPKAIAEDETVYISMLSRHFSSSSVPLHVGPIPGTELQKQRGLV